MYQERIMTAINYLTDVQSLLMELKFRFGEIAERGKISEVVENYLNSVADATHHVDLKLNTQVQVRQVWTKEEMERMPYLKDLKYRYKDGIHEYRYRREGFNESFSSKNQEVAKKKAYEFIKGLKKIIQAEALNVKGKTFEYVALAWIELKKSHTGKSTYRVYEGVYRNHIAPVFAKRAIKNILPLDLQPFFNELFRKHEKTCEDAKIIMNGIFKYAVANRLCPTNPMAGVIVEKHYRQTGKALTDSQLKRFRVKMDGSGNFGLACLIILYSGARGFELPSITFNWESGTMTMDNAKLKKSQRANPNNLKRTIPIFPALFELRTRIEATEEWRIKTSTLTCKFCNYWTENTVKDLRHTFITKAREAGIGNELDNIWTGHSAGRNLTANTYTHFSMKYQLREAKKLKPY